jgi:hypothetical protein
MRVLFALIAVGLLTTGVVSLGTSGEHHQARIV